MSNRKLQKTITNISLRHFRWSWYDTYVFTFNLIFFQHFSYTVNPYIIYEKCFIGYRENNFCRKMIETTKIIMCVCTSTLYAHTYVTPWSSLSRTRVCSVHTGRWNQRYTFRLSPNAKLMMGIWWFFFWNCEINRNDHNISNIKRQKMKWLGEWKVSFWN